MVPVMLRSWSSVELQRLTAPLAGLFQLKYGERTLD